MGTFTAREKACSPSGINVAAWPSQPALSSFCGNCCLPSCQLPTEQAEQSGPLLACRVLRQLGYANRQASSLHSKVAVCKIHMMIMLLMAAV